MQIDPTTAPEANNAIGWSYLFKKNPDKAQEYYDKGSAAGRADARLKTNIERLRKGLEMEQQALEAPPPPPRMERPDVGTLSATLTGGRDAGSRRKAARDLATYGADAAPALISAIQKDSDWSVKEQACNSLGALGPKASAAVPTITYILKSPRVVDSTVMTKEQMALSMLEEDFRKACRDALLKIQGR
jgi:HEAT repeat protein